MKTYEPADKWLAHKVPNVRFVKTGEFRAPRKGEWYISRAMRGVWRAPNDLVCAYQIARPVRVELVEVVKPIRPDDLPPEYR